MYLNIKEKNPNQIEAQDLNGHFSKEDMEVARKHIKRCSASISIRELRVRGTMWYCRTWVRMVSIKKSTTINAGEGM